MTNKLYEDVVVSGITKRLSTCAVNDKNAEYLPLELFFHPQIIYSMLGKETITLKGIQYLMHPFGGIRLRTSQLNDFAHQFVLTDQQGTRKYCFSFTKYYAFTEDEMESVLGCMDENEEIKIVTKNTIPETLFYERTLTIISSQRFNSFFQTLLTMYVSTLPKGVPFKKAHALALIGILDQTYFPYKRGSKPPNIQITDNISLEMPYLPLGHELPFQNNNYFSLFFCLEPKNILKFFYTILNDYPIAVVSKDLSKIYNVCESMLSLIYPFTYKHTYVPLCNEQFKIGEFLDSMDFPCIFGFERKLFDKYQTSDKFVVVDLDNNKITSEQTIIGFPKTFHQRLFRIIENHANQYSTDKIREEEFLKNRSVVKCKISKPTIMGYLNDSSDSDVDSEFFPYRARSLSFDGRSKIKLSYSKNFHTDQSNSTKILNLNLNEKTKYSNESVSDSEDDSSNVDDSSNDSDSGSGSDNDSEIILPLRPTTKETNYSIKQIDVNPKKEIKLKGQGTKESDNIQKQNLSKNESFDDLLKEYDIIEINTNSKNEQSKRNTNTEDYQNKWNHLDVEKIRKSILDVFVSLLFTHNHYINYQNKEDSNKLFDKEQFIKKSPLDYQKFLQKFIETRFFFYYIEQLTEKKNGNVALFQKLIINKINTHNMKYEYITKRSYYDVVWFKKPGKMLFNSWKKCYCNIDKNGLCIAPIDKRGSSFNSKKKIIIPMDFKKIEIDKLTYTRKAMKTRYVLIINYNKKAYTFCYESIVNKKKWYKIIKAFSLYVPNILYKHSSEKN
ncbi:denn domain-containing protein [Anaeramoeba flamelloides]|uniref:Denn domain-containing protein n=1 Tax=Anaeramoeba flamelloides TaxID=1746091 RepID=A0ABQ8YRK9_9EUKA|nr:denn domain-containing protein [Anaeramoeba flamelloides]